MNQRERNRTLVNLRRGQVRVLVATDVAARGIDVAGISHVINFDLPKFAEDYVHRIGRTGRGGATGISVSFASNRDAAHLKKIEQYTGQRIEAHTVAGLEPKFKPRPASGGGRSNGAPRHHAPDSRHGAPRDSRGGPARREGHSHNRFEGNTGFAGNTRTDGNSGSRHGNVDGNRAAPRSGFNAGAPRTGFNSSAPRTGAPRGNTARTFSNEGAPRTFANEGAPRRPAGKPAQGRGGNNTGNKW
jgi:superfamily II DNA/RNA helicase